MVTLHSYLPNCKYQKPFLDAIWRTLVQKVIRFIKVSLHEGVKINYILCELWGSSAKLTL